MVETGKGRACEWVEDHEPVDSSEMMRAMAAACAILAIADGTVAPDEGRRLFRAICDYARVSGFSDRELLRELAIHERNFIVDRAAGHAFAAAQIRPIARERQAALRLLDACRFLVIADGIAHLREFRAILTIRSLLGLERLHTQPAHHRVIADLPSRVPASL
jgi:tellurite resistance protein TerB